MRTVYLEIDNNSVERAIWPFVIGRRKWLFTDTVSGANASANLYSLIETVKLNGLEPYRYFCRVLEALPASNIYCLGTWIRKLGIRVGKLKTPLLSST